MNELEKMIEIGNGFYVSTSRMVDKILEDFCHKRVGRIGQRERLMLHLDDQMFYIHGCNEGYCMDKDEAYEKKIILEEKDYQTLLGLHNLMCELSGDYKDLHEKRTKSPCAKQMVQNNTITTRG